MVISGWNSACASSWSSFSPCGAAAAPAAGAPAPGPPAAADGASPGCGMPSAPPAVGAAAAAGTAAGVAAAIGEPGDKASPAQGAPAIGWSPGDSAGVCRCTFQTRGLDSGARNVRATGAPLAAADLWTAGCDISPNLSSEDEWLAIADSPGRRTDV